VPHERAEVDEVFLCGGALFQLGPRPLRDELTGIHDAILSFDRAEAPRVSDQDRG